MEAEDAVENAKREPDRNTPLTWLLERFDTLVYLLVGLCFCLAAVLSLAYGIFAVVSQISSQIFKGPGISFGALIDKGAGAQDIIALVSDLLLTLIIMEVLGTVVHHLRERETTLKPFLFIGIISATRGILAVGARLSVSTGGAATDPDFQRDMIELAVNAAVIIALGVAMKLIGDYLDDGTNSRRFPKTKAVTIAPASDETPKQ